MNNATGIKAAQKSYQLPFAERPSLYSADSAEVRRKEASDEKTDTSERVTISQEAYQLKREYAEEKEDLRLDYQQDRQELKREYQQEKKRLEQKYERKKETLDINVYI